MSAYLLWSECDPVAYCDGVGGTNTANAEVAFDLAFKDISRIRFDGIAVARVAYYKSVH